jgi:TM2 domain-containing membrane protein YozV
MFCTECGSFNREDARFCKSCATPTVLNNDAPHRESRIVVASTARNPGVAAVLSFFLPGLGQLYNSQIGFGIVLMLLCPLLYLSVVGWIWAIVNARNTR